MEAETNENRSTGVDKNSVGRRSVSTLKQHDDRESDDVGATWSATSNGGFSRSSHDEGQLLPREFIFSEGISAVTAAFLLFQILPCIQMKTRLLKSRRRLLL